MLFVKLSSHKNIAIQSNYPHNFSSIVQNKLNYQSHNILGNGGKEKKTPMVFSPTHLLLLE